MRGRMGSSGLQVPSEVGWHRYAELTLHRLLCVRNVVEADAARQWTARLSIDLRSVGLHDTVLYRW